MVWFVKILVPLPLSDGRGSGKRSVLFVHYMEVIAPLNAVEKNLGCVYVWWSAFDEVDHTFCCMELIHGVVRVGEWYGIEIYRL